jgi:hypothetical protein
VNRSNLLEAPRALQESDLCAWLGAAQPGEMLVYHRGFLAVDCSLATSNLAKPERSRLALVARRAALAQERGLACLLQRRHGPDNYSYLIVRRRPSSETRESFAVAPTNGDRP